ncbi:hypothetical protein [Thalassobaculum sp.]|jgi:hypothetical protein|uniref:hypothetical protein n=1 Tax=Thalassobaculum sp. TaxID=2022740 RepID=UPI003B5A79C8
MTEEFEYEQMDATNARAIEALQALTVDTGLTQMYGEALELVREIAAETARMVAEIEAEHALDAA